MAIKRVAVFTESGENEKILTKIFFSDNVERSSKYLRKKIFADVKAYIKKKAINQRSGGSILQDFKSSTFKTWNIM